MVYQTEVLLPPFKRGCHLITGIIQKQLPALPESGIVNIFIQHTSAGLTINENFDSSVREDMTNTFDRLIPDNIHLYSHNSEGEDDMPAHVKSTFTGTSLNIPITKHHLGLGVWQGIYLCEFRNQMQRRKIVLTILN
ncbi:MAG TPA: secondary thiamine-phosphate synthase enzyme YjbQ [Bacteroidales bacterium]|nr:secondary thiamine-phosphate synthase enzyme YjbQ [Bacteroidales bacterium]